MNSTIEIAKFATKLSFADLPSEVLEKVKMCVLDSIGVMIQASTSKIGKTIADFIRVKGGKPDATVICSKFKAPLADASMVNGALMEIPENQDGLRYGGIHQSSSVIPASLAMGEHMDASGRDFIAAVVLGYEVCGRIAAVTHPKQTLDGFVPVGTIGPFGAAAASGKLLMLNEESMISALGIAGFLAPISRLESFYKTCKPLHGGQAASVGILAALLAAEGIKGSSEIIEGYCKGMVGKPNLQRVTQNLGKKYEIMETYLKPYTSCRHTHGAIEATLKLVREFDLKPSDIEDVIVKIYNAAHRIVGIRYPNVNSSFVDVQFSIPYTVAAAITDRAVGLDQISEDRIKDPRIHELAKKVKTIEDPELTKIYPDKTAAIVEITTEQEEKHFKRIDIPKGDPRNPLTWEEIKEKFRESALHSLNNEQIMEIEHTIMNLEKLETISELTKFLS
ncbi:MAG: MmgE/PrpD family protein [Candidatus Bathyarchaeota archaeon]|nr:MAG: MmgE/PrpD family protein [Candidatus Bathyarchaeota archaeon]